MALKINKQTWSQLKNQAEGANGGGGKAYPNQISSQAF
jgi:hypothetical protein